MSDPFADSPDQDDTVRRPIAILPAPRKETAFPRDELDGRGLPYDAALFGEQRAPDFTQPDFDRPKTFSHKEEFGAAGFGSSASTSPDDDFSFGLDDLSSERPRYRGDPAIDRAFDLAAINPLVSAASPLLWLASRLNESAAPEDVAELRRRVLDEIRNFETAAMAKDTPERIVRLTRYVLCAVIDDIVLNTRWGASAGWASQSLVGILYNETWGGERFYDLLQQLLRQPDQNIDVLELMAICLAVGFTGKYRVMDGGQGKLARLRQDLYRTIRKVRGPYERNLSAAWQSMAAPHRPPRSMAAPWAAALVLLALLVAVWAFSAISLRGTVQKTAEQIRALSPAIPVFVERAGVPSIPDPVQPVRKTQIERLSEGLAAEIADGRIEVVKAGDQVVIRMLKASFPSGGVEIAASENPLITKIGAVLDAEKGNITVIGHTDDVPVGPGSPLGDNMAISVARARSAAQMLQQHVADPARVGFEGRGSGDPIVANNSPENRARNRRVEFRIPAEDRT